MADYRLHCFADSGNAYKAALMLELCGLDWEAVPVRFFEGETRRPEWREGINEMGEAPVLEHGGERISQSGVILDYLAERTGRFGAADPASRREIWRWILFDNHKFTSYFASLRFFYGIQKTGDTPVTDWLRGRVRAAYGVAERHLAARDFMLGSAPTIADFSMVGYMFYSEETGLDRATEFPNLERWVGRIAALPGWRPPHELMPSVRG